MKPGETLNPGGKPVNSRNRLQGKFLRAIADDFELHGLEAIQRMREEKPERYIECIAALMPKEFAQTSPLDGYTEEEIDNAIAAVEATIVAKAQQVLSRRVDHVETVDSGNGVTARGALVGH